MDKMKVDIIIPVYRPTEQLFLLLEKLGQQTLPVNRIILVNTEREFFEKLMTDVDSQEKRMHRVYLQTLQEQGVLVLKHITKEQFDHGKTRKEAVALSDTPFFVLMTDDAIPKDNTLLENLLAPFTDERVAMTYGRQLPSKDCGIIERFTREFNYPKQSITKSVEDIPTLGIKAFFASNVCAAYRRDVFDLQGGFITHTIFNEDMIYARGILDAGYQITYAADACVLHSHNYSGVEQFKRNFDLGVSHAENPAIFSGLATESEGIKLVKKTCGHLLRLHKPWLIIKVFWQSGCKYLGFFMGKRYQKLPFSLVKACSMNKTYWNHWKEPLE